LKDSSSIQDPKDKDNDKAKTLIAWRLNRKLIPMFNDLAQQAYDAHLIKEPKLTALAKFSKFFAEMWLQQKIAHSRHWEQ
jgi:hypothetical protein